MPTTFLSLPSELRQAILILTYDATTSSWSSKLEEHIAKIENWSNTLNDVLNDFHINLTDDLEYAKSIWLKQLQQTADNEWYDLLPKEREAIWHGTRGGISPWRWVHQVLLCLNVTHNASPDHAWQRHQWGPGPSGMVWDSWGYKHPPSTWDHVEMEYAAVEDIEWLERTCLRIKKVTSGAAETKAGKITPRTVENMDEKVISGAVDSNEARVAIRNRGGEG
jgi:hypothetical protein